MALCPLTVELGDTENFICGVDVDIGYSLAEAAKPRQITTPPARANIIKNASKFLRLFFWDCFKDLAIFLFYRLMLMLYVYST